MVNFATVFKNARISYCQRVSILEYLNIKINPLTNEVTIMVFLTEIFYTHSQCQVHIMLMCLLTPDEEM